MGVLKVLFSLPLLTAGGLSSVHLLSTRPHCCLCAGWEQEALPATSTCCSGALLTVSELLWLHTQLLPWVSLVWARTGDLAVQR